jgi:DNA-binding FadR family transcriptional regulator
MAAALDALYARPAHSAQKAARAHEALHRRIAECARCPELLLAIEKSHVLILNWLYNSAADFHPPPRRWHRDLAAMLTGGDPDEADRKMREHVRFGMETVLRRLAASHRLADAPTRVFARTPRGRRRPRKISGKPANRKGK